MNFDHLENSFYFNYYRIGQGAYRDKVKYFEDHKEEIFSLDIDQQHQLKLDYLLCLFEIGRYEYFLSKVDEMIEVVIIENIFSYNNSNIFHELLFRKSACLYNIRRYKDAEKVLKSLIKLDDTNVNARMLFTKCRRKFLSPRDETTKAVAMVFLLSALSISVMELLIVKPFYDDYITMFSVLRIFLFATAAILLLGSELYFKYNVGRDIGYRLSLKSKFQRINKWYIDLTGGKIKDEAL